MRIPFYELPIYGKMSRNSPTLMVLSGPLYRSGAVMPGGCGQPLT
jgi:hypothetical protein